MSVTIPTIYSTLFLTVLLFWGLVSFLRGSIRDRTADAVFAIEQSHENQILMQVREHFLQRAYRVVELIPERDVAILLGQVRPSVFLAIFLSALAAMGLTCLGLVLGILIPDLENLWLWLIIVSPIAGVFYWRGTARERQVCLQILPDSQFKIRAHKDEIEQLQRALKLEKLS